MANLGCDLGKLIRYEAVHEINGWSDLHRRLEADRRCFAFFHPALIDDPIIFVEVALSKGLTSDLGPLLDIQAPLLAPEKANTAIFYSINNCLHGLRGVPFGSFLIKQVVVELAAELPNIKTYATLSPLPQFSRALSDQQNEQGFTHNRLSQLLDDYSPNLTTAAGDRDPVKALFRLLEKPLTHRKILAAPNKPCLTVGFTCRPTTKLKTSLRLRTKRPATATNLPGAESSSTSACCVAMAAATFATLEAIPPPKASAYATT